MTVGGVNGVALAIRELIRRSEETTPSERSRRALSLATVLNSTEPNVTIRMTGFPDPVPAVSSDLFDLFPLSEGDVVVVAPLPGGTWMILTRVGGTSPEVTVGPDAIDAALVLGGPPLDDGGGDAVASKIQWYRSPASVSYPAGLTDFTWTFDEAYGASPFVLPTIQSSDADRGDLSALVKSVTSQTAVLTVKNANVAAVPGRLVAMAHGTTE